MNAASRPKTRDLLLYTEIRLPCGTVLQHLRYSESECVVFPSGIKTRPRDLFGK